MGESSSVVYEHYPSHPKMIQFASRPIYCHTEASTSRSKHELIKNASNDMTQVVAMAVISRLQVWCIQLFWITVFCVMGCCGDEKTRTTIWQLHEKQQHREQVTQKRTSIAEIERKLLRHITSPLLSNLRPSTKSSKKRHQASRPPSPQLFDIVEESED